MQTESHARPATRTEVIDVLEHVFDGQSVTRSQLMEAANDANARSAVLDLLDRLPERPYWQAHQLWLELPEVPLEA